MNRLTEPELALIIAPHTDDGELGAGAVMAKLAGRGVHVHYLALSTGHPGRGASYDECFAALDALGIFNNAEGEAGRRLRVLDFKARRFTDYRQEILDTFVQANLERPWTWVFGPSGYCRHQDHQVVHAEMARAFPTSTVLGYWTPDAAGFIGQLRIPVEERHVKAKLAALERYKSQAARDYMQPVVTWGRAAMDAIGLGEIGRYAEAFEVVRLVTR